LTMDDSDFAKIAWEIDPEDPTIGAFSDLYNNVCKVRAEATRKNKMFFGCQIL